MPANLPPTYYKLKHQHEAAKTDSEQLELLEEMLRIVPQHKGSEKVVSDLRKRIARLKRDVSASSSKKGGRKGYSEHIPKQGAGQIVLLGPPNGGKSEMLATFTKAKPEVGPTPYITTTPTVGMLRYQNVQFQLIDTPSIMPDFVSPTVLTLARHADLRVIVLSLASDNLLDDLDMVLTVLHEADIIITDTDRTHLVVANQQDADGAADRLEILTEFYGEQLLPISTLTGAGSDSLFQAMYNALNIIRIYPKAPGKPLEHEHPIVLPIGATVQDAAIGLHKDFAGFKFARIWGPQWHAGQSVSRDDVVYDGDVVEFHL